VRAYYISAHEQVRVFIPVTVVVYYLEVCTFFILMSDSISQLCFR
jgi:hypothetical protein